MSRGCPMADSICLTGKSLGNCVRFNRSRPAATAPGRDDDHLQRGGAQLRDLLRQFHQARRREVRCAGCQRRRAAFHDESMVNHERNST